MAKAKKRGLPSNFKLDVDEKALDDSPVDLDDFVDSALPAPKPPQVEPRLPVPTAPRREPTRTPTPKRASTPTPAVGEEAQSTRPPAKPRRRRKKRPSRKEIGLDAQTLQKLAELLSDVQAQSGEPSATASEVVRAAISALYESRRYIDYANLGSRGQWGSLSARNFMADLQDVYLRALRRYGNDRFGGGE